MEENLGGRLDIHKNAAFLMLDEDDCYGKVHPRDAMLPEVVLLLCTHIQQRLREGKLVKQENEIITITKQSFCDLILECREKWIVGWSKEYREMDEGKLVDVVKNYMESWMFIREYADMIMFLPAVGKQAGFYPEDFEGV